MKYEVLFALLPNDDPCEQIFSCNTCVGKDSGKGIGEDNCIFGQNSLTNGNGCNSNIFIGSGVGNSITTGSQNIYIVTMNPANENDTMRLGHAGIGKTFVKGISGVTTGGAAVNVLVNANEQLGTISSSRDVKGNVRNIENTSFLYDLQIKNFEYKIPDSDELSQQKHAGIIAEELELLKPELIITQGNGVKTVDYHYLFVCAIKEIQLLKKEIEALKLRFNCHNFSYFIYSN